MADLGIEGRRDLEIKFDGLLRGVSDAEVGKVLMGLGMDIKTRDMPEGFRKDLGSDLAMSNWPTRGNPAPLVTGFKIDKTELTIKPQGRSYGPLSMLESGRQVRRAGQFRSKGGYTSKKTGASYTRLKQVTRNVGPMAAKRTWSDGAEVVERRLPPRLQSWLNAVIRQSRFGA